ncbi:aa3-type cytochrome oxidase subunit CtaJ [Nocardia sp. CA-084685]|uniref:aa3-type cytochrome oxidase subunit CtaJ n=1 Tax=Nocardia sp. CA-084685 TaxID=3239970 RepID=UPI003D994647
MSILETVLIFLGIPLVIYGAIAGLSYLGKPLPGEKPVHFDLGQKWTQPAVLWSATDEVTGLGHYDDPESSHRHHAAIESTPVELIGGRASGKF